MVCLVRSEDRKPSRRVFPLLQNLDLDSVTFAQVQGVGDPITIEDMNEQEMVDLIIVNLARLVCAGEWSGLLEAGGGAETLGELTDVLMDATNWADSILIQPNSDGSAPTTGTLNSATNNVGIGSDALAAITQGVGIVAIGQDAGKAITNAAGSVIIGREAGAAGNPGSAVLIGGSAGKAGVGNNAIHIGVNSGRWATGFSNTFVGADSGYAASNYYNVGIGEEALGDSNYSGIGGIGLGRDAGNTITTGDFNVIIGSAAPASITGDSQLSISDGSNGAVVWIVGTDAGTCYQGDNAATWSTTSDRRLKREIADATKGLDAINAIQVRTFRYRKDNRYNMDSEPSRVGVIAQELEEVFPEAVLENAHGHKTVSTDSINWALLKAVQELSAKVEALESAQ